MKLLWRGRVGPSKSIVNRALIISSFSEDQISIDSKTSEDIQYLEKALFGLKSGACDFYLGDGGTSFRFFVLRASREDREISIRASKTLLSRPIDELIQLLGQLGVWVKRKEDQLCVRGPWRAKSPIKIDCSQSTQFASAFVLSSIDIDCDIELRLSSFVSSKSYFLMSLSLLNRLTELEVSVNNSRIFIQKKRRVKRSQFKDFAIEDDWSSAASIGCLAVLSDGKTQIENLSEFSLQVDSRIVQIFNGMGIVNSLKENTWTIESSNHFSGIKLDLEQSPDLFPVLAVLCTFARSSSEFTGLKNLRYKESNRLKNIESFLTALGTELKVNEDSLIIKKTLDRSQVSKIPPIDLSPDSDHRIAMAGAVAIQAGARVTIDNQGVVKKSFSHFWDIQRSLS